MLTVDFLSRERKAFAFKYSNLSLMEKVDVLAKTFGYERGTLKTKPCRGKQRGYSDIIICFEPESELLLGNLITKKAKLKGVQNDLVDEALELYNPEIVELTKTKALKILKKLEKQDSKIALKRGLAPYKLIDVDLYNHGIYLGSYYVKISINGNPRNFIEAGLKYSIVHADENKILEKRNFRAAGGIDEKDIDFIFRGVGFSTKSSSYSLPERGAY